jgi:predicted RNase H-like HicB family nuclease
VAAGGFQQAVAPEGVVSIHHRSGRETAVWITRFLSQHQRRAAAQALYSLFQGRLPAQPSPAASGKIGLMKYPVALTQSEEGYSVCCPGLPGCWSQGATEEEALANIRDAIHEYLEVARQLASGAQIREVDVPA